MILDEIETLAAACRSALNLERAELGNEYGYRSVALCVIDAVWSIGVRYGGVQNVITRYCDHCGLKGDQAMEKHTVKDLLIAMDGHGVLRFSEEVFRNAQRTSTRGGILKAEAVYQFATVIHKHGMETINDVPKIAWYEDLPAEMAKPYARELLSIPGQRSGISLAYFYMLTGSHGLVKPDRMVNGFLRDTLDRVVTDTDAQRLISHATRRLQPDFPELTTRMLDHQIWKYQRAGSRT